MEGGEEDGKRSAKRRRQTDEGAEAEAEGEGRPTAEGVAGAEEAVQGPEVAEAVQQHHDEDSAVQALKQLSDQVGSCLWVHTCVGAQMSELCPPHPPHPASFSPRRPPQWPPSAVQALKQLSEQVGWVHTCVDGQISNHKQYSH